METCHGCKRFRTNLRLGRHWELWWRIGKKGKRRKLSIPTMLYRENACVSDENGGGWFATDPKTMSYCMVLEGKSGKQSDQERRKDDRPGATREYYIIIMQNLQYEINRRYIAGITKPTNKHKTGKETR